MEKYIQSMFENVIASQQSRASLFSFFPSYVHLIGSESIRAVIELNRAFQAGQLEPVVSVRGHHQQSHRLRSDRLIVGE